MLSGQLTSIKRLKDKILSREPFIKDLGLHTLAEYIGEAMDIIGLPTAFIEKTTDGDSTRNNYPPIKVENYRGKLPCGFVQLKHLRYLIDYDETTKLAKDALPMRRSGNSYQLSKQLRSDDGTSPDLNSDVYTATLQEGYIYTNFKEGYVEIVYTAYPVDEYGYPLISEDEKYMNALVAYVAYIIGRGLYMSDQLSKDKYQELAQDWHFKAGSAYTRGLLPDMPTMEGIKNQILQISEDNKAYSDGFNSLDNEGQRYNHNSF